ncbi:hypothetical protein BASA50_009797 [Batrachochytrium salamandrivorans]|uniref:DUF1279 domain-containing protein n=1 Tax=Batrachochytrium salamandrivorans TaxID=1357716 RepID=A0ABQ8F1H7_9FUNG|nr:hypothetical protein BASA60_010989 [Batrachochytrium salamandrivorans]KAH6589827.1 hypothetical protein BASA50_009797 [Batrachochytrium salamandrivorans]KAH9264374.1 hypothetical protein BASA83_012131 [Batrachochytrium salamandrivorans]
MSGWRAQLQQLKDAPASHITAFAVLHEATALLPLPLIYWVLSATDIRIPFPQEVLAEGNRRMARMMQLMSLSPPLQEDDSTLPQERVSVFQDDSQFMLHVATAYAIVKVMMPVRIAGCLMLTPWTARAMQRVGRRLFKQG